MSTTAHILSGSLIALTAAGVTPSETGYIILALVAAGIVDIDHLFYLLKDHKKHRSNGFSALHEARSLMHELLGVFVASTLAGFAFLFDQKAALIIIVGFLAHVSQDLIMGKSYPMYPFENTVVELFPFSAKKKNKVKADLLLLSVSGVLWILYLKKHF